jgi:DNA-directed RNA polymerase specialized sigma24 family protein
MVYLNDKQQQALEDKYFLNKSTVTMAEEYGCTERAVRGLLARARKSLVRAFANHGEQVLDVPIREF